MKNEEGREWQCFLKILLKHVPLMLVNTKIPVIEVCYQSLKLVFGGKFLEMKKYINTITIQFSPRKTLQNFWKSILTYQVHDDQRL